MKKFNNFLNESRESFTVTLGRAFTGFQNSCYRSADTVGIDINIERIPGILIVSYRITINGDEYNVNRFIDWVRDNYVNQGIDMNGEYEECEGEYEEEF